MKAFILLLTLAISTVGCASVEHTQKLQQPTNKVLIAGVGDVILKVNSEKDLPNVFGKADLYGRKTPTGTTTIQYKGISNGIAHFVRRTISIETNATTMNSSPLVVNNTTTSNHSGNIGGVLYNGTTTTSAPPTVVMPNTPQAQYFPQQDVNINISLKDSNKEIIAEGYKIQILNANQTSVSYSIDELK